MKCFYRVSVLLLAVLLALSAVTVARASTVYGNTGAATTFYVDVRGNGAHIELISYKGRASVESWSWSNAYRKTVMEEHYGYYSVIVSNGSYRKQYDWAPSKASGGKSGYITTTVLSVLFPSAGNYTVQVIPFSNAQITDCLNSGSFKSWINNAIWVLDSETYCSCSFAAPRYTPAPAECRIRVSLYDNRSGQELKAWYETLHAGYNTVSAGAVPYGYRLAAASQRTVYVDSYGNPSDNAVYFPCEKIEQITPQPVITQPPVITPKPYNPGGGVVMPYGWDTQFRYQDNNPQAAKLLPNLSDGDLGTSFHYTIWYSDRTDAKAEITAFFYNATVSSIGFVNGVVTTYNQYSQRARAGKTTAKIYTSYGVFETSFEIPDTYTQQFQVFSLGGTYTNVEKIELYLEGFYQGKDKPKYEMNITEIQLYE